MTRHSRRSTPAVLVSGFILLTGCAWWDGNDQQNFETAISRVSTTLVVASTEETSRHAALELAIARDKLAAARQTASAGDYEAADRLLSESLVNIQLAAAKADAARVQEELERMKAPPHAPARAGDGASEGAADGAPTPE